MIVSNCGSSVNRGLLRRYTVACGALLILLMTTGCHHKAKVSRYHPPPPPLRTQPRAPSSAGSSVPRGMHGGPLPSYAIPDPNVNDNAIASGHVSSTETGLASWYGPPYHNRQAANGEVFDQNALTAAHRTLPMGTVVRVTNLTTQQSVTVRITDRGPFVHGRLIDLSLAAAKETGIYRMGLAKVRVEVLQERPGADLGGKWCVQIGAFLDKNNAWRLQSDLQRRYATSAKVIEFQGPTGHWVRINPISASRTQALQIASAIRTAEPDAQAYLVRLD
ncbi:rare lipoprotein A [Terriglobus roseus DSM 18391]|uniref:Probable endolytic peptidoglycan transglycosylase RlpA n=1 Tax=Terriglobus roseus (strain DSM 18391 / NRRL B-41598 / KBS 63) TaxID=926566 RepID=I3ZLS6_TERRK|nr:septal ring lytic transglycosylase RlpA family protein [Terriglobus roseus]AFL90194.1 rare lipoprotein A [Terriglobus roseus DSM 18391]